MKKRIAILGSTGSIGVQTLEVAAVLSDEIEVVALAAGSNDQLLSMQITQFKPKLVAMYDKEAAARLRNMHTECTILDGEEGLLAVATHPEVEVVVTSLVGTAGLLPTLAAIRAGKDIALANKETLVAAGEIVMAEVRKHHVHVLPVDSEHSAIFQCLQGVQRDEVSQIILTASGGPFRGYTRRQLQEVQRDAVFRHPNWAMGQKITVDSATMMNKGLEVIEAKWLFDVCWDMIEVVVHPQSIIHSMIETVDGAVLAQLGLPDMRVPIQYALTYPTRNPNPFPRLNFQKLGNLTFESPNTEVFPALSLAFAAGKAGGTTPAVLNAANEMAVSLFLDKQISFASIIPLVDEVLQLHTSENAGDVEVILAADRWARCETKRIFDERGCSLT